MSEPDAPPSGVTAPTAPSVPAPDRLFAGRYRLTGRRGTGLDIALFEAVDVLGDRTVAVKIIHPDICAQPGFDDRFTDTVHRVASVRHPNVAEILDIGAATWNGQPVHYVVCENLTGGSLRDLRDRGRSLSASQVVMVGLDVCRGLDAAHRAGLVHGDIRPANLVFGDDGRLRITDLGLADLVSDEIWANPASVSTDRARYASPEQAVGAPPEAKSDVYSLCLCLLEAVTGQLPFIGDSTVATLQNRVDRLMPVSADLGPLAAVLERAGRPGGRRPVHRRRVRPGAGAGGRAAAAPGPDRAARHRPVRRCARERHGHGERHTSASGSGDETTVLAAVRPAPPAPAIAATAVVPVAPPPALDPALTVPLAAAARRCVGGSGGDRRRPLEPATSMRPPVDGAATRRRPRRRARHPAATAAAGAAAAPLHRASTIAARCSPSSWWPPRSVVPSRGWSGATRRTTSPIWSASTRVRR